MSTHAELFKLAHETHVNWQIDRPLIDKFNHSNIKVALELLGGEIKELNGGDEVGIFSAANIENDHRLREDYRQQEISDIIVFAMTAFDELRVVLEEEKILSAAEIEKLDSDARADEIYAQATEVAQQFGFAIVEPGKAMDYPEALSDDQDEIYGTIRGLLNQEAELLLNYDSSQEQRERLPQALERVLVYAVAMHSLIGVDSGKAVMEKVARNMLKYPAWMFALPEGLSPEELKEEYDKKRAEAATLFDGPKTEYELIEGKYLPVDRSRMVVLDPDNVIWDRPKTGTERFYRRPETVEFDHSEARPIGIWYRAVAQVIASTYGFSVKVSNLLKRD